MSVYLNEWTNESLEVLYELTAWYPNSFIYSHVMKAVTCLPVHKNGRISNSVFFLLLSGGYTSHNQPIKRCLILLFQADERKRVHGTECWFEWCVRASCFPQLANYPAEKLSGKKKKKDVHADSFASGCLCVCMRVCPPVCLRVGVYRLAAVWMRVHKTLCPRTAVSECLLALWTQISPLPPILSGCLRDVRFNGRSVPLGRDQPTEGLQVITSQGVSVGCYSEACRKHHCSPPLVCVDLWRHPECR